MSSVNTVPISGILSLTSRSTPNRDAKIDQAGQQFEALLIGQILHSVHASDGGWLGNDDSSASCGSDFAEEQLANTIAQQGGFGLAKMISESLEKRGQT